MNWQTLSSDSHYKTAVAIRSELELGHVAEAAKGIEELIEALSRSEKRALKSQLVRLMLQSSSGNPNPKSVLGVGLPASRMHGMRSPIFRTKPLV